MNTQPEINHNENIMNKIIITVTGQELENISIELTSDEVKALYNWRKEKTALIEGLEKKLNDKENSYKYLENRLDKATDELAQAHTLLGALGVAEKSEHEEQWQRKDLPVATRIALYLARTK